MSEKAKSETNSDNKSDKKGTKTKVEEDVKSKDDKKSNEVDTDSENFKNAVNAEVERIVQARVARERDKSNKLQEEIDELKTQDEASQEEASNAKEEIKTLVEKNTVYEVSYETGLSKDVVSSLKGDNKEDLLEAASLVKQTTKTSIDNLFNGKPSREKEKGIAASILKKYNQ